MHSRRGGLTSPQCRQKYIEISIFHSTENVENHQKRAVCSANDSFEVVMLHCHREAVISNGIVMSQDGVRANRRTKSYEGASLDAARYKLT